MCIFLMLDVEEQCLDVAKNGWSSVSNTVCRYVESAQRPDMAGFLASQMDPYFLNQDGMGLD